MAPLGRFIALLVLVPVLASAQVRAPVELPVPAVAVPLTIPKVPNLDRLSTLPSVGALPLLAVHPVPAIPKAQTVVPLARPSEEGSRRPARLKPLRLILTGPPGSGKGTYAERIALDYGPVPISAGALLREYAEQDPDVAAVMQSGRLVRTELVVSLVKARLMREDVRARGFLLDGFPRRLEEARRLEAILKELGMPLDGVIFLEVPREELLRRVLARGRADDNETTFDERMRVYDDETRPVIDYLRGRAPFLAPPVASGDAGAAYEEVRRAVEALLAGAR